MKEGYLISNLENNGKKNLNTKMEEISHLFQPKKLNLEMFQNTREKLFKMNKEIELLKEKIPLSSDLELRRSIL